jgi:hypothetical protein
MTVSSPDTVLSSWLVHLACHMCRLTLHYDPLTLHDPLTPLYVPLRPYAPMPAGDIPVPCQKTRMHDCDE